MSVSVNGKAVPKSNYEKTEKKLSISNLPKGSFDLEITVDLKPQVSADSMHASDHHRVLNPQTC